MKKILIIGFGAALALASASAAADADGAFFINAGIGQAQYHVGTVQQYVFYPPGSSHKLDDKDTAGALRFGYAWKVGNDFNLGVEGGYANLGKTVFNYAYEYQGDAYSISEHEHADVEAKGWLFGVNGRYAFASKWYVSARAGWFRSTIDATYSYQYARSDGPDAIADWSGDADGDGWYGGVGVGYDFAPNFSLGLNYDNYHAKAETELGDIDGNIGAFTLTAEYRF